MKWRSRRMAKPLPLVAAGLMGAAAVAFPAWASGGGDASGASVTPAATPGNSAIPLPPPVLDGRARQELDDFMTCMQEHGIDPPGPGDTLLVLPEDQADADVTAAAKACGGPPPPTLPAREDALRGNGATLCLQPRHRSGG
jgi:hypothetical protein